MICHSVVFTMNVPKGSSEEKVFMDEVKKLASIPGVKNFECLPQISKTNDFDYGISMEFDTLIAYERYNEHPDHIRFIENFWKSHVGDFLELDFERPKT